MRQVRVILIGGFLGSGKTTLLRRTARHLEAKGKRVALVTNDQAPDLVDTELLKRDGFAVSEASGGCFCCKFDALVQRLQGTIEASGAGVVFGRTGGKLHRLAQTCPQPSYSH